MKAKLEDYKKKVSERFDKAIADQKKAVLQIMTLNYISFSDSLTTLLLQNEELQKANDELKHQLQTVK